MWLLVKNLFSWVVSLQHYRGSQIQQDSGLAHSDWDRNFDFSTCSYLVAGWSQTSAVTAPSPACWWTENSPEAGSLSETCGSAPGGRHDIKPRKSAFKWQDQASHYLGFDHVELACLLRCVRQEVCSDLQHGGCLIVNDMRRYVTDVWLHALLNDILQLWVEKRSVQQRVKLLQRMNERGREVQKRPGWYGTWHKVILTCTLIRK